MRPYHGVVDQAEIRVYAGPAVLFGASDHCGADWVEFNVSIHLHQVALTVDEAGFESPLPEWPTAAMPEVECLYVALSDPAHGRWQCIALGRGQE